ncbi:MAG: efflux RND transporter periplasmic adaptor subunit, partial [Planctomycetota bacterium]
ATDGQVLRFIDDGTEVEAGTVLLELENQTLVDRLDSERLKRDEHAARLIELRSDMELYQLEAAKDRSEVERALRFAQLELTEYVEGSAPLRENELRLAVERAEMNLAQQSERLARMPALAAEGFVTSAEVEDETLRQREQEQNLAARQQTLDVFLRFEHPRKLEQLAAKVSGAEIDIKSVEARVEARIATLTSKISTQEQLFRRCQNKATLYEDRVAGLVIRAPQPGIVIHGDPDNHRAPSQIEIGSKLTANQVVMSLPNLSDVIVEADITEAVIDSIEVGQPVQITMETDAAATFNGEVLRVANTVSSPWGPRRYAVELSLGNSNGRRFRPGMSARVAITTAVYDDVLSVPIQAVYPHGDGHVVYVDTGSGPQQRAVTIGANAVDRVVIIDGVAAGDTVCVLDESGA